MPCAGTIHLGYFYAHIHSSRTYRLGTLEMARSDMSQSELSGEGEDCVYSCR